MIRIEIPLETEPAEIDKMKQWLMDNCDFDEFYFFPMKAAVDRPAIFKFENKEDAFAFRFMYNLIDLVVIEE